MRPHPLQPHNTSRDMAASGEKKESLADFLKDSEALAILHEQQISAIAAQKAAAEMAERLKQSDTPLLSTLRRKISSTFVKDAPEQPKRVDQDSPSSSHSKGSFFRKGSNTKSNVRGDSLQSISESDTPSPRASRTSRTSDTRPSDMDNKSSQGREEQPVLGKTHDPSYSNKEHTNPTPASKASTHRPLLVVNTSQASQKMATPGNDSPAPKSLPAKDKKDSKQSSPGVTEPSTKFSPRFLKPKTPRFKDSDPEIKAIERMILQEEWGVNTTSELTAAYRKRPPTPAAPPTRENMMSFAESAAISYHNRLRNRSQPNSNNTTNILQPSTDPVHKRETSNNSMESTGSVVRSAAGPHHSVGSALSASDTYDSRASTFPSSALRASGGTSDSVAAPSTPETSNAGGSLRFRHKDVGSGHSLENSSGLSASPTSYLGGGTGHPRTGQYSSSIFQSPVRQSTGRSFTDPHDGQASIDSIKRATRAAFLDLYDRPFTDSTTSASEQHTMSSHESAFADSNANQIPRPSRRMGGGSLEAPSGKTNTSSDPSSYEHDVLQPRGHGSNEFTTHPNALPGASSIYNSSAQDNSRASNAISGNVSGPSYQTTVGTLPSPFVSGGGGSRANFPDVPSAPATASSPSNPSSTTAVRDFQPLQTAGVPSNRLQLEEDAEEDRRRRRMTKQNYVAYRVSHTARNGLTTKAYLFIKLHLLRKKTKTEIIPWDGHDNYPRHPNHGRKFHSVNLWCNHCTDKCARCSAACCVLKASAMTALSDKVTKYQKAEAVLLQREIQTWLATGVDNKTFLDCTECRQFVCPKCTSICPVEPCCDRLCIGCNPDHFWQPCDYHSKAEIDQAFKRQRERMEDNLIFLS